MFILLLTLFTQCCIPFIWKRTAVKGGNPNVVLLINYTVTMAVAAISSLQRELFSVFKVLPQLVPQDLMVNKTLEGTAWIVLYVGIMTGVVYYLSLYASQRNIALNGMGVSSFFSQTGLVGSLIVASIFFAERITVWQWCVIGCILFCVFMLAGDSSKFHIKSVFWLIAVCVMNMAVGIVNKFFAKYAIQDYKNLFLSVAFLTALLSAGIKVTCVSFCRKIKTPVKSADFLFGSLMGLANAGYSYLNLRSLELLPVAVVVPTLSAGGIIVSTMIGYFVFKEPVSKKQTLFIAISCILIVLLNI